jgi:predicted acyl esterase
MRSSAPAGIVVEKDIGVPMSDGVTLRAMSFVLTIQRPW